MNSGIVLLGDLFLFKMECSSVLHERAGFGGGFRGLGPDAPDG